MTRHIVQMVAFRDFIVAIDTEGRVWELMFDSFHHVTWKLLS